MGGAAPQLRRLRCKMRADPALAFLPSLTSLCLGFPKCERELRRVHLEVVVGTQLLARRSARWPGPGEGLCECSLWPHCYDASNADERYT